MLKVQVGSKGARTYFSAAFVSNALSGGWLNGFQLAVGYIF